MFSLLKNLNFPKIATDWSICFMGAEADDVTSDADLETEDAHPRSTV
jgi:hypothetical protein